MMSDRIVTSDKKGSNYADASGEVVADETGNFNSDFVTDVQSRGAIVDHPDMAAIADGRVIASGMVDPADGPSTGEKPERSHGILAHEADCPSGPASTTNRGSNTPVSGGNQMGGVAESASNLPTAIASEFQEVVCLGIIRATAGEKKCEVVRVEFPLLRRPGIKVQGHDELSYMTVRGVYGNGRHAEVILEIDARRSGKDRFMVILTGKAGVPCVRGEGVLIISRPNPYAFRMQTVCGGSVSMKCPIRGDCAVDRKFKAFMEPEMKEFWLSQNKGVIRAGAKEFPFSIFFAPRDVHSVETLLVVECEDVEICVRLCGGGFERRESDVSMSDVTSPM
jgi:hypothetical protein